MSNTKKNKDKYQTEEYNSLIEDIDNLINNNQSGSNNFINKILKQKPSSYKNIKTPIMLQGPENYSSLNMKEIWKNEKDLDSRLRIELQKILDKKYPYITSIYNLGIDCGIIINRIFKNNNLFK